MESENAGMRGQKASYYDGGHRVPFFMRWPAAGFEGGRDITEMTLHIDVLPTFIDLCDLASPEHVKFDGQSFVNCQFQRSCHEQNVHPAG